MYSSADSILIQVPRLSQCLDRAALVAVHPSLREKYVAALDGVLKPGARILLVGMNYNQVRMLFLNSILIIFLLDVPFRVLV